MLRTEDLELVDGIPAHGPACRCRPSPGAGARRTRRRRSRRVFFFFENVIVKRVYVTGGGRKEDCGICILLLCESGNV